MIEKKQTYWKTVLHGNSGNLISDLRLMYGKF